MTKQEKKCSEKNNQIVALEHLVNVLKARSSVPEKLDILGKRAEIAEFFKKFPHFRKHVEKLDFSGQLVIKSLIVIGQGEIFFKDLDLVKNVKESLTILVSQLLEIEKFYDTLGGIVGYHLIVLKLIHSKEQCVNNIKVHYEIPPGIDISKKGKELNEAIRWGLDSMHSIAEMYPVGGAGERLNLKDENTGEPLPAAQLQFCGRTLLELLIRDLQGREFLYFKLFGKQVAVPLAIMTSHEKDNHHRILEICKSNDWFGRRREDYRFFIQPLVPLVTAEGEWMVSAPLQPILKPGGHGVIWKAALDEGIFDWFDQLQKKKILIRQINNPMAGVDSGLLAFMGIGCKNDKDFGFSSCNRMISAVEGMNVLKEVKNGNEYEYCITNIEYTDFKRCEIADAPNEQGSIYSCFPANTNILFVDVNAVRKAIKICPIPGMLINLKSRVTCYKQRSFIETFGGRLESTMQNIADYIVDRSETKLSSQATKDLRTFLTYNERRKTISVAKQSYSPEKSLTDTPEGCFFDLMQNYRDLLINHCRINLPNEQDEKDYLLNGPDCLTLFHPALGMLYSVICQKVRGGKIASNSEFILEISEVDIFNIDLEGSLIIEAKSIMGNKNADGVMLYDDAQCGKCTLKNVKIRNDGRVRAPGKNAWKCQEERKESLNIILHGNAEFFAEDLEFQGDVHYEVQAGHRLVVYRQGEEIAWHYEKIRQSSWQWDYFFEEDGRISIEKHLNKE